MKYLILMKANRSISTPKHLVYDTQACYHIYNEIDMNFLFIWMDIQYSGLLKTILLQCPSWSFLMCSPQHWSFATYDLLFVSCFWTPTGSLNFNDALIQHIQREFPSGVSFHLLFFTWRTKFLFFFELQLNPWAAQNILSIVFRQTSWLINSHVNNSCGLTPVCLWTA